MGQNEINEAKKETIAYKKNYIKYLKKQIDHWNKYRDEQNELHGYMSFYINYKNDIRKMIEEDEYIKDEIDNANYDGLSDDSYYSDDEKNRNYNF